MTVFQVETHVMFSTGAVVVLPSGAYETQEAADAAVRQRNVDIKGILGAPIMAGDSSTVADAIEAVFRIEKVRVGVRPIHTASAIIKV